MVQKIKNTQNYNILSAIFACLLWGFWSFYINAETGFGVGLVAAFTQGISSFLITLFMTYLIEKQFNYYQKKWMKILVPPICTVLFTGTCLVLAHMIMSTPNIVKTVTPALSVATIFAFITNFKLYKQIDHS
jgi:ABC-type antimicrobial peptide transport system permease subunit